MVSRLGALGNFLRGAHRHVVASRTAQLFLVNTSRISVTNLSLEHSVSCSIFHSVLVDAQIAVGLALVWRFGGFGKKPVSSARCGNMPNRRLSTRSCITHSRLGRAFTRGDRPRSFAAIMTHLAPSHTTDRKPRDRLAPAEAYPVTEVRSWVVVVEISA